MLFCVCCCVLLCGVCDLMCVMVFVWCGSFDCGDVDVCGCEIDSDDGDEW